MTTSCIKEPPDPQRYTVTVTADGNGTASATPPQAEEGTTVTLTATPSDGYVFKKWIVEEGIVELADAASNPTTLVMPAGDVGIGVEFIDQLSAAAVYHEGIGSWIVPQNDPYALENIQKAYDNLSARPLAGTRAGETLDATHYALKIYPRSEDEQLAIELMQDVKTSYIPFTYEALTEIQIGDMLLPDPSSPEAEVFPEASPYIVDHDDLMTVEGDVQSLRFDMPILYVVWPIDKDLPDEMDYEIDYEVYLPSSAQTRSGALDAVTMLELEEEAIRLALGYCRPRRTLMTRAATTLGGEFWIWEDLKDVKGPVPRVKVKFHLGSNIIETAADSDGRFDISASDIPAEAHWEIMFQDPKWKVTRENSTIPKSFFQGDVYQSEFWSGGNTYISVPIQPLEATIVKSLDYFYYRTHPLTKWEVSGGLHVIANPNQSSLYNGLFTFSSTNNCYITIYRNNTTTNRSYLMGTVFHELGHFIHYRERGGSYGTFKIVDRFLQESFASWSGWYFTDRYFAELGYARDASEEISGQSRQYSWMSTRRDDWGYYSPLFVDLMDNYNQSTRDSKFNNDGVKGIPAATIMKVASESADWASCNGILRADKTITGAEWDKFLAPYEQWYAAQ
jgi:hypothetical protein